MRELRTAVVAILVMTVLLGLAYPLAMTGVSQALFGKKADGDTTLLARPWVIDTGNKDSDGNEITTPDPKYFQPRPSQTGYSATATFFSNRGPNAASARFFYRDGLKAYISFESKYTPGLTNQKVPVDAVTESGSGVDPHISKRNAAIQANRIAAVRHIPLARVKTLIKDNTDGRFLGLLGEPGVNTTKLNLALDKETA